MKEERGVVTRQSTHIRTEVRRLVIERAEKEQKRSERRSRETEREKPRRRRRRRQDQGARGSSQGTR